MNKKNLKPLILSALGAMAMAGIGTGATFALFTDKAETQINVQAGIVDVDTTIEIVSAAELGGNAMVKDSDTQYHNSIDGSVALVGNTLSLQKWAPGDKVVLRLTNVNKSNVAIKTRLKQSHSSSTTKDLFERLNVSYQIVSSDTELNGEVFRWRSLSPATDINVGKQISVIEVTIEFPNHDDDVTEREKGIDNAYQNAGCSIVFAQEAVQGNAQVASLPDTLNASLSTSTKVNTTLSGALNEIESLATEAVIQSEGLLWDSTSDTFLYEGETAANTPDYKYFAIYNDVPTAQTYSIYASSSWNAGNTINGLEVGFDAGSSSVENIGVKTNDTKNLVYKTNGGTLTIDAPNATFNHYGTANVIEINSIAGDSYHEFGKATFVRIGNGRVVVEKEAEIGGIHIKKTENAFQDIKVGVAEGATLPALSRDSVSLNANEKKLVVEVQALEDNAQQSVASSQYVWIEGVGENAATVVTSDKEGAQVVEETAVQDDAKQAAEDLGESKSYEEALIEACDVVAPEIDETKNYVARIGLTGYESFDAALAAAKEGDIIALLQDIESENGYSIAKNISINTNGHKITVTTGANVNNRAFRIETGYSLSVYGNGKIIAEGSGTTSSNGAGCYGAFRAEVGSALHLKDLTLENARPYGLNVKILGAVATLENVKINSSYGGGIEVTDDEGADGTIRGYAKLSKCQISQQNYFDHCSSAVSVSGASVLDVEDTNFEAEYGAYVFSSGGTINISGGTWTGKKAVLKTSYDAQYGNAAYINITGGTFNGALEAAGPKEHIAITGGRFSVDPNAYVVGGKTAIQETQSNYWVVDGRYVKSVTPNEDGKTATVTYALDSEPGITKTEQVRYLQAKNLGEQTTNTTFDVYCGDELLRSGVTLSNIFNTNSANTDLLIEKNVLVLPEGNIYFQGDSYINSEALFVIGAKDAQGNPATRLIANGTASVSYKGLQSQNREAKIETRTHYFENVVFDGAQQQDKWGHLLTATCYGLDIEFNNVSFENFTQAGRTAVIGIWANDTKADNAYPTFGDQVGVDIRLTNVKADEINGKPFFQFQGFTNDVIAANPDCYSYISIAFDEASKTACGLGSNSAFVTQDGNNNYGPHYHWTVNGQEVKSVSGTQVQVY